MTIYEPHEDQCSVEALQYRQALFASLEIFGRLRGSLTVYELGNHTWTEKSDRRLYSVLREQRRKSSTHTHLGTDHLGMYIYQCFSTRHMPCWNTTEETVLKAYT